MTITVTSKVLHASTTNETYTHQSMCPAGSVRAVPLLMSAYHQVRSMGAAEDTLCWQNTWSDYNKYAGGAVDVMTRRLHRQPRMLQ